MNCDVERHLGAVERFVSSLEREGKPVRSVTLAQSYDTTVDDLWDAVTNAERLPRWFLPINGEFELGGRYQLEGNAGGVITACEPPSYLAITWEFGGDVSWVEIRLADEGSERARLMLNHIQHVSEHWDTYGPGAVGVGWELSFFGLALHLAQPDAAKLDEAVFSASPEGKAFTAGSSDAWGRASIASGTDTSTARAAARRTTAFYTGETQEGV